MRRIGRCLLGVSIAAVICAALGAAVAMTADAVGNEQPIARTSEFG